ncbi:hypothetical protein [Deinococcus sp. Leaf326]|uniref:hypothetical protein n=1 Tax=Deinococcus sp. Leaf326 TaxID=1736338 RepID=UPI0006FA8D83|nr:hypothetical protein [Deinococcus sp. Leaf326]KQR22906.1 hypothetical protein ASF71_06985 [Deinococcus sp. Leaf326]
MTISAELETLIRGRKARGASKQELSTLEAALELVKKAETPSFRKRALGVLSGEPALVGDIAQRLAKRKIEIPRKGLSAVLIDLIEAGYARREMVTVREGMLPRWAYASTPAGEDFLGDGE